MTGDRRVARMTRAQWEEVVDALAYHLTRLDDELEGAPREERRAVKARIEAAEGALGYASARAGR